MAVEEQIRTAIRDGVNRSSRKPFHWGGLAGYHQLEVISQALHSVSAAEPETAYLHQLAMQVDRAVAKNRALAQDLAEAHTWLTRIADCLRYPPEDLPASHSARALLTSAQVSREMVELLQQFQPDFKRRPAQTALYGAWHRLWKTCGSDLLYCYDIPGLPQDNLKMEALFGHLRSGQRRISGRKSTRPLRDFGQYRVLFVAESEEDLLQQMRQVSWEQYQAHRRRLAEAEAPRQQLWRLHRDPVRTMRQLLEQHATRRAALAPNNAIGPPMNTS
jgi:hypothetical protein